MAELILSIEGHIRPFLLEKAIEFPLLSITSNEIRFFFNPGT
jgi:hypothetical protein